jgi:hypothetical protein
MPTARITSAVAMRSAPERVSRVPQRRTTDLAHAEVRKESA